jgi:hypothetical protein
LPVDINTVPELDALGADPDFVSAMRNINVEHLKDIVKNYRHYGYDKNTMQVVLSILKSKGVNFFDVNIKDFDNEKAEYIYEAYLKNCRIAMIFAAVAILLLVMGAGFIFIPAIFGCLFFNVRATLCYFDFYRAIDRSPEKNNLFDFLFRRYVHIVVFYPYMKKQMKRDMNSVKW